MKEFYSKEQIGLRDMVRDFAEKEIMPISKECDVEGRFPLEVYEKAFKMGLQAVSIPEKFGGTDLGYFTNSLLFEEIARADAGFAVSLITMVFGVDPFLLAGTDEQIKKYADYIVPGGFSAFGLTEPDAGSDAGGVQTTAVKIGDEYVLNGTKRFITNGAHADIFTIFANTDPSNGKKGLTAFYVEKSNAGIHAGAEEDKMGCRLSNTCDVILEDCVIPASNMLGSEGQGFKLAMECLNRSRPLVGAMATGISRAALEHSIKYANERIQFGKPISKLQAIQMMLADMDILTETSRQIAHHAAKLLDAGEASVREGSIAKTFCCDSAMNVTIDAIQIFGGYGYSREYPVEKLMRDAKIFQIFEGTNQIQRLSIANSILKKSR